VRVGKVGGHLASGKTASVTLVVGGFALVGSGTDSRASLTSVPGSVLASTDLVLSSGAYTSQIRQYRVTGGEQIGQISITRSGASQVYVSGMATLGASIFVAYTASDGSSTLEQGVGQINPLTGVVSPIPVQVPTEFFFSGQAGLTSRDNRLVIQNRGRFAEISLNGTITPTLVATGTDLQLIHLEFATDVAWNGTNYLVNMYRESDIYPVNTIYSIDPVSGAVTGEIIPPAYLPFENQSLDFDIATGIMRSSGQFFINGQISAGIKTLTPTPGYFDYILNNGTPTYTDIATWNIPSPAPATLGLLLAGRIALRRRR
jgi:hypothetical protein